MRLPLRRPIAAVLVALLAGSTALPACNDYPVHRLLDTFEVRVTTGLSNKTPIKLDFLWVIDHSPSMCQEQVDLASGFQDFIKELNSLGGVDAQMAVATVQQVPDITPEGTVKVVGQFARTPATMFPPNCIERIRLPCTSEGNCIKPTDFVFQNPTDSSLCPAGGKGTYTNPMGGTDWKCKATSQAIYTANDNCSINSYCWKHCSNDQQCRDLFEPNIPPDKQRIKCYVPGGTSTESAGCQYPPATEGCPSPDKLPNVLRQSQPYCVVDKAKDASGKKLFTLGGKECNADEKKLTALEYFRCNATVGASQTQESKFEGGFRSAWYALDPGLGKLPDGKVASGPNCPRDPKTGAMLASCQYKQLVREDGYLIIVFVSDDDDCSVNLAVPMGQGSEPEKEALKKAVPKEIWERCQIFNDAVDGNTELVEGQCEYRKSKDPKVICPNECLAKAAGSPERATCDAAAAKELATSRAQVAKTLTDFGLSAPTLFSPVAEYVNLFRSLKSDPARVIVATITGDTVPPTEGATATATTARDRVLYYRSTLRNIAPGQAPYVCEGKRGESGYGSRYVKLANAFRENGAVFNICKGASFGPALKDFAQTIKKRVVKVCLPHPPNYDAQTPKIKILRTRAKQTVPLKFVADPTSAAKDSFYIKASPDCRTEVESVTGEGLACGTTRECAAGLRCIEGLCKVYAAAVYFTEVLQPNDEIQVNYAADLGL
ncbi:MAG: hypothetical protein EXR79_06225 [Myxococcales bacterium]|nr:hypothetical protein [Myxococcales bacterium]